MGVTGVRPPLPHHGLSRAFLLAIFFDIPLIAFISGTDFRHKGVVAAGVSRLQGILGREVGRIGPPRHVGIARRVQGDTGSPVVAAAAQVGGVDERAAGGTQFGHKGVGDAGVSRLEPQDFLKLHNALPDHLKPVLTMAYYTGMRVGEILSLRWEQVDLWTQEVRLNPGGTKNDEARTISFEGELHACFRIQKEIRYALYPGCPWVFFRKGKPIRSYRQGWERGLQGAGLHGLLVHDLRRSGVRNLLRAGVHERVAMAISGHKTRSVFDRYNIVSGRDLKEAAQKLDMYLNNGHNLGTITFPDKISSKAQQKLTPVN
jgi:integrase